MLRKKVLTGIAVLSAIVLAAAAWALPGWAHDRLVSGLQGTFRDASISVGPFAFERPLAVSVSDIRVEAPGYRVLVAKAAMDRRLTLTLTDPRVTIKKYPDAAGPGGKNPAHSPAGSAQGLVRSLLGQVVLRGLVVELKLPNVKGEVRGTLALDLKRLQLRYARLETDSIKSGPLKIERIVFDLPESGEAGTLTADRLSYEKLRVTDIRGVVVWHDMSLSVEPITASWIKGTAAGRARASTGEPFGYSAALELKELDLDAFTKEFKLNDKMSADGKLAGKIEIEGDRSGVRRLDGSFDAGDGGDLIVQDANFLKYLADSTKQPAAIVEAAFKDYHFDSGTVAVQKKDRDLGLSVKLAGAKGRRDFDVRLHDLL